MIFVDTSFWAALTARADARHQEAASLLERHQGEQLVTSNQVRGESWTLLRRRRGHSSAVAFLDLLERTPRLRLEHIPQALEDEALVWLRRHDEREYSFVDATSFVVMRSLGIRHALAFDDDFTAAGFVQLSAE